ncbi:hypothetical protein NDU88_006214 [Pleurodeles waltl]|uniref:Uncharacterized protein n=1 Tax=Pleurodeles waltl TaxID=8319 RepID=A0AAV7UKE8_PLEWA|nr:hypothetical protein NDU88_006214 [Pleurodeles waltl]
MALNAELNPSTALEEVNENALKRKQLSKILRTITNRIQPTVHNRHYKYIKQFQENYFVDRQKSDEYKAWCLK